MQKLFENLTVAFRKHQGEMDFATFEKVVRKFNPLDSFETTFLLLQASGYPIESTLLGYRLKTFFTPYKEQVFTVIDIETNGAKPVRSQVIEVGAVKIQNGKVIDSLESFVNCAYLPEHISQLTGIQPQDLVVAPSRQEVLGKLKEFLGDSVFVAHNVNFDYTFLNASFERFGLGPIGNMTLCTIDLAKKTIKAPKYGLAFLNEFLELQMSSHHRAYSDALATSKILEKSLQNLPSWVKTTDDLILFSKNGKKKSSKTSKKSKKKSS
jgi:DNA polymerase-3 subunit epsilon